MKKFRSVLLYVLLASLVAGGAVVAITQFDLLGPTLVSVRGMVTRDGKPLEWKTEDSRELTVIFIPEGDRDNSTPLYPAVTDVKTGEFHLAELPTGSYSVAVQQLNPGYIDLLGMVYDPGSTNIKVKVTEDGQVIPIDIPKVLPPRRTANPAMPGGAAAPGGGGARAPRQEPPPADAANKPDDKKAGDEKKADDKKPGEKK